MFVLCVAFFASSVMTGNVPVAVVSGIGAGAFGLKKFLEDTFRTG
jgi:hypothetical protein